MSENWVVHAKKDLLENIRFSENGLVPCIAQDRTSREVLMMAWMDREALSRTLKEGRVTYFSRSRSRYWKKGSTSGNIQVAHRIRLDCDSDVLLAEVDQSGPSCHTGAMTCFSASEAYD